MNILGSQWILMSLLSAAAYATSSFLIYVVNRKAGTFNASALNLVVYTLIVMYSAAIAYFNRDGALEQFGGGIFKSYNKDLGKLLYDREFFIYVLLIAAATVIGNIALYSSYILSPNPGFCDVASSLQSLFALIISVAFFAGKAKLINIGGLLLMLFSGFLILG